MNMTRSAVALMAATAAITTMTACATSGTPVRSTYTGPERNTEAPGFASQFAPGIDIRVGEGDDAVTCTAGWVFSIGDDGSLGMAIPGHCAPNGKGTPVSYEYLKKGNTATLDGTQTVSLGEVIETTYAEPYNPQNPDYAVVGLVLPADSGIPASPAPGAKVITDKPVVLHPDKADSAKGSKVCWYHSAQNMEYTLGTQSCGKLVSGTGNKILVTPDKDDFDPVVAGAPATIKLEDKTLPLGIVTDVYRDHIIIDVFFDMLEKTDSEILTATIK